nr:integrase, catalytic region, zinc finger, CCHC-type, peptidase aspartic, catalytic [Tanacetum cinerariifolium]
WFQRSSTNACSGSYAKWQSRIMIYIDLKPNHKLTRKCIFEGPYEFRHITVPAIPADKDIHAQESHVVEEIYGNVNDVTRVLLDAEEETGQKENQRAVVVTENKETVGRQEVLPEPTEDTAPSYDTEPLQKIVQIIIFIIDSGCTKHLTWYLKLSVNIVEKNLSTVRVIEELNQNLFSVGQFCDADLEVAFKKSTCYVRDSYGNDLLTGTRAMTSLENATADQGGSLDGGEGFGGDGVSVEMGLMAW